MSVDGRGGYLDRQARLELLNVVCCDSLGRLAAKCLQEPPHPGRVVIVGPLVELGVGQEVSG